jgi:hypothetical protein
METSDLLLLKCKPTIEPYTETTLPSKCTDDNDMYTSKYSIWPSWLCKMYE